MRDSALDFIQAVIKVCWLSEGGSSVHHVIRLALVEEGAIVELKVIYLLHLVLTEPFDAFTILPEPVFHLLVFRYDIFAKTMLFSLIPVALVTALVGPRVYAEAVLLIVLVLSLVLATVVPDIDAHPLHIVVEPLAFIATAVQPCVDSHTADLVFPPVSGIPTLVVPLVRANAVFPAKCVIALVTRLVCPRLYALAVL